MEFHRSRIFQQKYISSDFYHGFILKDKSDGILLFRADKIDLKFESKKFYLILGNPKTIILKPFLQTGLYIFLFSPKRPDVAK